MSIERIFNIGKNAWKEFSNDPLPGWGSRSFSLFDVTTKNLGEEVTEIDCGVASVPFDTTASTRVGARYGPRCIREASLAYSSQQQSRNSTVLRNMRTGELLQTKEYSLADYGDLHVYPSDPYKQMLASAAEVRRIAMNHERVILLGGEHSLSFPFYCGVAESYYEKQGGRVGYVQIDNHFDFGDTSVLHGPYYHGSNGRRISEYPRMSLDAMGFVGVGDLTTATQFDSLIKSGTVVRSIADIRARGFVTCLRETLDQVLEKCDALYISIDIDVCDTATVTGTGHVTVGGINSTEFLSIASVLRKYPVAGLDLMEVSPGFDGSGATGHLVSRLLFEWLFLEEVKK